MWLYFQKTFLHCLDHGLPNKVLFQIFYRSLNNANKAATDQLMGGGIMRLPFMVVLVFLDQTVTIN